MPDYQNGHMSGADNNVEKLTGRRSMTVGEFARAHGEVLNGKDPLTLHPERSRRGPGIYLPRSIVIACRSELAKRRAVIMLKQEGFCRPPIRVSRPAP